jgi:hypothetical protein
VDELELLRDVARAAAAFVKAEADCDTYTLGLRVRPEDEWTLEDVEELHRLSSACVERHQELIRALDRLAETDPPG